MSLSRRQVCRGLGALGLVRGVSARRAQAQPTGEAVWAWHVSLAPAWFDPVDTPAQSTPFGLLYALHDALIRPPAGESAKTWGKLRHYELFRPHDDWQTAAASGHHA
jgi:hypothetical protein